MEKQLSAKQLLGQAAEQAACSYLTRHGLTLIARNFHARQGEIDLIMLDKDTLVFVEVRFRSRQDFGDAAASVTRSKQQKIIVLHITFCIITPTTATSPHGLMSLQFILKGKIGTLTGFPPLF